MRQKTKKQFVLNLCADHKDEPLTGREINQINAELVKAYGAGGTLSGAEIAQIAESAGRPVSYFDLASFDENERYEAVLAGVLKFDSLSSAETSLRALNRLFRQYEASGDAVGMRHVIETAKRGKHWASVVARNRRVKAENREIKAEIAEWFALWLRTPELFDAWVELRRRQIAREHPEWLESA